MSSSVLTKETGCPVAHDRYTLTAGPLGPCMITDVGLLEKLQLFNREKTPARNVHALGTGVYGTFTVTNDITKYTKAKLFSSVGKQTKIFTRFSGIFTEQGEADTIRDPRGFAIKFYTEEGNWDLMGINTPVFNVRDAKLGPDAIHACKRDARNGMRNPDTLWDFCSNHPESLHQFLMIFSDRGGTPMSYRNMDGYGCHTFSFINSKNQRCWCKFHIKPMQKGRKCLTCEEAKIIAGEDPNFLTRDLYTAIQNGNYPKWTMFCQIKEEQKGYSEPFTFDPTKVWKHKEYPLIEIGTIELNEIVSDFHNETEQAAFSPANYVPGIGLSLDRLLQGRLLIYDDSQHHRLGPNFKQIPVNCPMGMRKDTVNTIHIGGHTNVSTGCKFPNFAHSTDFGSAVADFKQKEPPMWVEGKPVDYYSFPNEGTDEDYYQQPRDFYHILSTTDREHLCFNLAESFSKVSVENIVKRMLSHLEKIDKELSSKVAEMLSKRMKGSCKLTGETLLANINQMLDNEIGTQGSSSTVKKIGDKVSETKETVKETAKRAFEDAKEFIGMSDKENKSTNV